MISPINVLVGFLYRGTLKRRKSRLAAAEAELAAFLKNATFGAIGRAAKSWAGLEIGLDLNNQLLMTLSPQKEQFPRSLSRKLQFFRQKHKVIELISPLVEASIAISSEIQVMSLRRHDMIHGFAMSDLSTERFMVKVHRYSGTSFVATEVEYSWRDFADLSVDAGELGSRVFAHLGKILSLIGVDDDG